MGELEKEFTSETLLENISADHCWAITAKILTGLIVLRIIKARALFGKGEGIIAPVMAYEKAMEISAKIMDELSRKFFPWVKEMFNIPVEDAIGAAQLIWVASILYAGPERESEILEETRERVVLRLSKCAYMELRLSKCAYMERLNELGKDPEIRITYIPGPSTCAAACQAWGEEGIKAINPQLTFNLTKATMWGDPYCEWVIEFKDE